jgi:hypothetical protein
MTEPIVVARYAALACLLLAASAACGGDDSDSDGSQPLRSASSEEDTYFGAVAGVMAEVLSEATGLNDLRTSVFDPALPEAERLNGSLEFGAAYEEFMTFREERLASIEPPGEQALLHEALVTAAAENTALAAEINGHLATQPVATNEEFALLFAESDGATLNGRFRDACTALQASAARIGVQRDLGCNQ